MENGGVAGSELGRGLRWIGPSSFTAAQWKELEQQALIYKHLVAGAAVPHDLLLSIRRSYCHQPVAAAAGSLQNLYPLPLAYGTYFGKKIDPEPGRCRRTDGKKWRCAKHAAPDSKYCERHMHRGRSRSRKPVEAQPAVSRTNLSAASTMTAASNIASHHLLNSVTVGSDSSLTPFASINFPGSSQLPCYGANKDFRYAGRVNGPVDVRPPPHFSDESGKSSSLTVDSPLSEIYELHCRPFLGVEFGAAELLEPEKQPPKPLFIKWPKTTNSRTDLPGAAASKLSPISVPTAAPSDSSTWCSPNDATF